MFGLTCRWSLTPISHPGSTAEPRWAKDCYVTMGSDKQTALGNVMESTVTAPVVAAFDELLWVHE